MRAKTIRYKTVEEFGAALGLTELDMALVRQKKKLIERLKAARISRGLSQARMAQLIGSKQPAIARMEAGQVSLVSMDFLLRAALVLGMSVTIRAEKKAA